MRRSCWPPAKVILLTQCNVFSASTQGKRKRARKGQRGSRTAAETVSGIGAVGGHCGLQPCLSELLSLILTMWPGVHSSGNGSPHGSSVKASGWVSMLMGLNVESDLASAAHAVPSLQRTWTPFKWHFQRATTYRMSGSV